MTATNDDKRRPTISRSKSAKSSKGQRTLFDMFGKNLERPHSEPTVLPPATQPEQPRTYDVGEGVAVVIPSSINTTVIPDPLLLTSEQQSTEIPTLRNQSNIEPMLTGSTFIDLDDSDIDILPAPLPSEASSQGSRDAPIIINSSPVRPIDGRMAEELGLKSRKPLHPFFAPRAKLQDSTIKTSPKRHRTRDLTPSYPDREAQHVKGPQSSYPSLPCPFTCRTTTPFFGNCQPLRSDRAPLLDLLLHEETEGPYAETNLLVTEPKVHIGAIDQSCIREHPAIARVVDATIDHTRSSSTQLWAEAWRPRCAKEVLGNERSAIYLRNWLYTLALQLDPTSPEEPNKKKRKRKSNKRSRVVREVPRKRPRKDGLDGFVVDDDEENDAYHYSQSWDRDNDDPMLDGSSQNSGLGDETLSAFASDVPEIIHEPPHNTILLTGPPGSGKTAAVFACAEELGWEIFEVYPGIARRNGANVDNLVGDVGKNHLVRKKQGATRQPSITTLLSNSTGSSEAGAESGCRDSGKTSVEYQGDLVELQVDDTEQTFRQSLILLEEVDLLFKDDVNFWPAVTNFIKDCRRPVICTCNDISLVPKDGLPIQKVLYFEPCAPDVATSYLQGLACAEGYTVPLDHIQELYSDTYQLSGADIPSDTGPPTAHLVLPDFDLRKAIHGLQMKCTTGGRWKSKNNCDWETDEIIRSGALEWPWDSPDDNHGELPVNTKHTSLGSETKAEREENIRVLDAISQQEDLISYLDSSVLLPLSQRKETLAYANLGASADDETGYTILHGSSGNYEMVMHGFHDRDIEMVGTAIRLARGRVAPGMTRGRMSIDGDGMHLRWALFRRRLDYQRATGSALWRSGAVDVRAMEQEVYTEYVPYIRRMVQETEEMGEVEGRTTRNSSKTNKKWGVVGLLGRDGQKTMSATGMQGR